MEYYGLQQQKNGHEKFTNHNTKGRIMEIYIAIFFLFLLTVGTVSFTEKLRQKEYHEWLEKRRRSRNHSEWF